MTGIKIIKLAAYCVLPVALFFVPLDWLRERHSVCLFKNLFGLECWGCGITRAVLSALHLDFAQAWQYNKLVAVVLPLLIYVWVKKLAGLFKKSQK